MRRQVNIHFHTHSHFHSEVLPAPEASSPLLPAGIGGVSRRALALSGRGGFMPLKCKPISGFFISFC